MAIFENRVGGIERLTFKDYPGKMACILFYSKCNAHCPYCYDADLVRDALPYVESSFIKKLLLARRGKIDAVVFLGGECTIWNDKLIEDIKWVKEHGFLVKVDTNGSNPELIRYLIDNKLVDYVAVDFKTTEEKSQRFFSYIIYKKFFETVKLLMESNGIEYELRTTLHPDVINEKDLSRMCLTLKEIEWKKPLYIQHFFKGEDVKYLDESLDRDPRRVDISQVDNHGIELIERN